jgi:hypothetical protein
MQIAQLYIKENVVLAQTISFTTLILMEQTVQAPIVQHQFALEMRINQHFVDHLSP